MTRGRITAVFILHCLLSASGCAKIADPRPPLIQLPDAVSDLAVRQVGRHVELRFTRPPDLARVEVFCSCPPASSGGLQPLGVREATELRQEQGRVSVFREDAVTGQRCTYALRVVNGQGRRSALSNRAVLESVVPARPPSQLAFQVHQDRIHITWNPPRANSDGSAPPRLVGYLVNRSHFVTAAEYLDRDFEFDTEVRYAVQSVSRRDPLILSEPSDTLTLVPRDRFPPAAPRNLTVLEHEGRIRLLWDAGREADLHGYFVYRGTDPNRLIKSSPMMTINDYLDESAQRGRNYYYRVTAVDRRGNESGRSSMVNISF